MAATRPTASPDPRALDALAALVEDGLAAVPRRPFVLGLCGAQGSGKTLIAGALAERKEARGLRTAVLSLDDLYLTRAERRALAAQVHPLFATRGPPGTHDIALGLELFAALDAGNTTALPRFDKAIDDRAPPDRWPVIAGRLDLLIVEGWCIGATPEPEAALAEPVNALERREDADAVWRTHANDALARYRPLFARIDRLALLAAPGFEVVRAWRTQQERGLRAERPDGEAVMDAAAIDRFVQHYERITRHVLADLPGRADLTLRLDAERRVTAVERSASPARLSSD
ncbi:MAG TPA: kinase [Sphingomonas sp.]|nr:kinase [Sphingomonas sp.]